MKMFNRKAAHKAVEGAANVAEKVPHHVPKKLPNKLSLAVTSKMGRQMLQVQKHSPGILFGAGVVGVVASTVLACRATLHLEEVLLESKANLDDAKNLRETKPEVYTEEKFHQDRAYLYVRSIVKLGKLYGPAIVLGSLSVAALVGSHNILNSRNASLTAAYVTVEKAFDEYRQRVVGEVGEERELEIRHNSEKVSKTVEDKNGPKKKQVSVPGANPSKYAKFFDTDNANWDTTPEYNYLFLRGQQTYANHRLQANGHVLLNDVYDALGMERTKEGCVVGWVKDSKEGDNYIDFGIFDNTDGAMRVHDFVTGREGCILLDFNVDGLVYDLI